MNARSTDLPEQTTAPNEPGPIPPRSVYDETTGDGPEQGEGLILTPPERPVAPTSETGSGGVLPDASSATDPVSEILTASITVRMSAQKLTELIRRNTRHPVVHRGAEQLFADIRAAVAVLEHYAGQGARR